MNNQISYAPKAREDLLEIKSFIEEETGDIELAKKTVSDILTTNDSLSIFPEMGQRLLINLGSKIEYRYLLWCKLGNLMLWIGKQLFWLLLNN